MTRPSRRIIERLPCPYSRCNQTFRTQYGRTQHINAKHSTISSVSSSHTPPPSPTADPLAERGDFEDFCAPSPVDVDCNTASPGPQRNNNPELGQRAGTRNYHPYLTGTYIWSVFIMCIALTHCVGKPCDHNGVYLPPNTPPSPLPIPENVSAPFSDCVQFRIADFLFRKVEMSQGNTDELMELWSLTMQEHNAFGPFENHKDMNKLIDDIQQGDASWKCFVTRVDSNLPADAPNWQRDQYQIWYRDPDTVISNLLSSPDFCSEFDASPYIHIGPDGKRRWCDFMSGNYA